ncbi:MAG: cyclic nucleotide-binding domain-containing protein [Chloroflexi bacterium]|nr:cyclic nucleotide-binding domain-containing protein [Chloroflexota bacterium]
MSDTLSLPHLELLASVELFASLDRVALARLAVYVEHIAVQDGVAVCRQGDAADSLYVVARGVFGVFAVTADSHAETRLATLYPGDYFGEMALLTAEPRSATVRAEADGEVLGLEQARFVDLLRRDPSIALTIAARLSRRLSAADQTIVQSERLTDHGVERALERLVPERHRQLLEASVLEQVSRAALGALFGSCAGVVAEDLEMLGVVEGQSPGRVLHVLRTRFEREAGAEPAQAFAQEAASRLAEAECWDEALGILARQGPRAAFLGVLGRAVRAVPPLSSQPAMRWAERIADEDAERDAELALLRGSLHEERGDPAAAATLLRRALGAALVSDPASGGRLSAEITRLARGSDMAAGRGVASGPLPLPARWPDVRLILGLGAAAGLLVTAAVGAADPRWVFGLLLASAIALWMTRIVADFVVSLGLVAAWVLAGIATPAQAMSGFASADWLFVLAILGIAAAVARSGLLFRVGLILIGRIPGGLFWQAGALLLTGLLLSPLLPMSMGRAALTQPLALAIAEGSRLRDREPAAAVLGLAAWTGSSPLMFLFLNASPVCLLAWGLLPPESRLSFDWFHWLAAAMPLSVFVALGALGVLFLLFRPGATSGQVRDRLEVQLAALGSPSVRELAMVAVLGLTLVGWLLASTLNVGIAAVAVLGLLGAVATGSFDRQALRELDWDFLVFFGVALSVGHLAVALGLGHVAAELVGGQLERIGASPLAFVLSLACLSLLVRLLTAQEPTVLLLGLAFIPAAPTIGVDPWIVVVTILATSVQWFLPWQSPSYLVAYSASEGRLYSQSQARRFAVGYTLITLAGLALSIPYWRLIGLL